MVLHTTYVLRSTIKFKVVLLCLVFWFWREIVFGVSFIWYLLLYKTVVRLCQFLVLAGNRFWFYILMYLWMGFSSQTYVKDTIGYILGT